MAISPCLRQAGSPLQRKVKTGREKPRWFPVALSYSDHFFTSDSINCACKGCGPSLCRCSVPSGKACLFGRTGDSVGSISPKLGGESMVNAMQLLGSLKRKMTLKMYLTIAMIAGLFLVGVAGTFAGKSAPQLSNDQGSGSCANLPGFSALKSPLATAVATVTIGRGNQLGRPLVSRDRVVCAVACSGV